MRGIQSPTMDPPEKKTNLYGEKSYGSRKVGTERHTGGTNVAPIPSKQDRLTQQRTKQ